MKLSRNLNSALIQDQFLAVSFARRKAACTSLRYISKHDSDIEHVGSLFRFARLLFFWGKEHKLQKASGLLVESHCFPVCGCRMLWVPNTWAHHIFSMTCIPCIPFGKLTVCCGKKILLLITCKWLVIKWDACSIAKCWFLSEPVHTKALTMVHSAFGATRNMLCCCMFWKGWIP